MLSEEILNILLLIILKLHFESDIWVCGSEVLFADGALVFGLEPLVDALRVVGVLALPKFLHLVAVLEVVHAHAALVQTLRSVVFEPPGDLRNLCDFCFAQPCCHLAAVFFLKLQELFVGHFIWVQILDTRSLATLFECFLEHFIFLY